MDADMCKLVIRKPIYGSLAEPCRCEYHVQCKFGIFWHFVCVWSQSSCQDVVYMDDSTYNSDVGQKEPANEEIYNVQSSSIQRCVRLKYLRLRTRSD